jgi:hydroxyethylthiazole kinase-like uncharacterized protein yjeF
VPPADLAVVTPRLLRGWRLPEPEEEGDKHARGTVLVVGGAASTPGAVLLAGLAALRVGAGRLQLATVQASQTALGVTIPEAAVLGLPASASGSLAPSAAEECALAAESAAVVLVGPGLLDKEEAGELLAGLLPRIEKASVVLDAVALTALARRPDLAEALAGRLVLTPNSGESKALSAGEDDELDTAGLARRYGAVVAAHREVAAPDGRRWLSESGGIGLGTSGSGDVLAGVVAGLLARGAGCEQAAVWGQYVHAAAGDRLAGDMGRTGYLARELLDEVVPVLSGLRS